MRVIGAEHEPELVRGLQHFRRGLPFGQSRAVDVHDRRRLRGDGTTRVEDTDLGTIDEVSVVGIHAEADRGRGGGFAATAELHRARMRGDSEPRPRLQVVETEPDVGLVERDVGASLHVGGTAGRIVDRVAVHGDAHQVERERALRRELARDALDVHAFQVVIHERLVVHDLHADEALRALQEARVDDVVGMHVAAALVLGRGTRESGVPEDLVLRPPRARGGQSHVVAIDGGRAPVQALVLRVSDEPQPRIVAARDIRERTCQVGGVPGRQDRLAMRQGERHDPAPGRIVDLRDHLLAGLARAELRLVGQLLQRVVVPELDLDAAVQGSPLRRLVGSDRLRVAAAIALDGRRRKVECILDGERDAVSARSRQGEVVSVDALVATRQRHVVGVPDETDRQVAPVAEIVERLPDLGRECLGYGGRLVVMAQRHDEVAYARPAGVPLQVAHLADRLHAADLDAPDVLGDDDLLVAHRGADLVVPDLDFHAAVEGPSLVACIRRDRLRVACPLVRDGFRRQVEHRLEILRDLACALAREARVVLEHARERRRQRLRVGMADEVHAQVPAVAHAVEDRAEGGDVFGRDLGHAGLEPDRRDDVPQLDGLELLAFDLADFQPVAALLVEHGGILCPARERLVVGEVAFRRLQYRLLDRTGPGERGHQARGEHQQRAMAVHGVHLPSGARISGCFGGPPSRQKVSLSMVSR